MSVLITLSDHERRNVRGPIFLRISLRMLVLIDVKRPNLASKHSWRGVFLEGQIHLCQSGAPAIQKIFWSPCYSLLHHMTWNDQIHHAVTFREEAYVLGWTIPQPKE